MVKEMTERQKGITKLRDLLVSYNVVMLGDEGWKTAYQDFMKKEHIALKTPTQKQEDYLKRLGRLGD